MKEGLRLAELGEIPFDEKEILRYAMLPSFAPAPEELPMKECLAAAIQNHLSGMLGRTF